MLDEVFTEIDLPSGKKATIYEVFGRHYFKVARLAGGDTLLMVKLMIIELVKVDGKTLTEEALDELPIRDVIFMAEGVNAVLSMPKYK